MATLSAKTPSESGRWQAGPDRKRERRRNDGGPQLLRLSSASSETAESTGGHLQNASSGPEQDRKEPRLSSGWNVPPSQDKLHIASHFTKLCLSTHLPCVRHYSVRPMGMTGARIFSVLQEQSFLFSSDTFIRKADGSSVNTKIPLKGQDNTQKPFIFLYVAPTS